MSTTRAISTFAMVAFLSSAGCSDPSPSGAGLCEQNDQCEPGEVCIGGDCEQLCTQDRNCANGFICNEDTCEEGSRSASPVIGTINGDGLPDTDPTHADQHLANGLVVTGTDLNGVSAQLIGPQTIELEVLAGGTATEIAALLPIDLAAGSYTLRIYNGVGEDVASITVLQGQTGPAGSIGPTGAAGPRPTIQLGGGLLGDGSPGYALAIDPAKVPGKWEVGRVLEGEGTPLHSGAIVGSTVTDANASGGEARYASAAAGIDGRMWGVTASDLGEQFGLGRTRVMARAKVTNVSSTAALATLTCTAIRAGGTLWTTITTPRSVVPSQFAAGGAWMELQTTCDFLPDDVNQFVGVDGFVSGVTDLWIDYVRVSPVTDNTTMVGGAPISETSRYVKEFSGVISGPGNWPDCTNPAKVVTIGTIKSSYYGTFVEITLYGSHRGFTRASTYFDYKHWVIMTGDRVSSHLVTSAGLGDKVGLYDGTTIGDYNNIDITAGFDIRLNVAPQCGSNLRYTYVVRYYADADFEPSPVRSW